jgi:hypothetical protein
MNPTMTLAKIRAAKPCAERWTILRASRPATAEEEGRVERVRQRADIIAAFPPVALVERTT